jgi:hypothetical protein
MNHVDLPSSWIMPRRQFIGLGSEERGGRRSSRKLANLAVARAHRDYFESCSSLRRNAPHLHGEHDDLKLPTPPSCAQSISPLALPKGH